MGSSADASARTRRASSCPRRRRPTMIGSVRVRPERERVSAGRARAEARPTLLTPMFLTVAAAELAYFTADGVLLPALPRYVTGPLGSGNVAVGLVMGAFSLSAFFLRPWAGGVADRGGGGGRLGAGGRGGPVRRGGAPPAQGLPGGVVGPERAGRGRGRPRPPSARHATGG